MTSAEIRTARGKMTRARLAVLLRVTPMTIYYWERGKKQPRGPAEIWLELLAGPQRTVALRLLESTQRR